MEQMKPLEYQIVRTQYNLIEEFQDEYSNLIKKHQNYLYQEIIDIISNEIRGIPFHKIENCIDDNIITELKYDGTRKISKLGEDLEDITRQLLQRESENLDKFHQIYEEEIIPPMRKHQVDNLNDILRTFVYKVTPIIEYQYQDAFMGISDNNFERCMERVRYELKMFLNRYERKFEDDYQELRDEFKHNLKRKVSEYLENEKEKDKERKKYQPYQKIMSISGYELFEENDSFYAQNKTTKETFELMFKSGILTSKDTSIRFVIDEKKQQLGYQERLANKIINTLVVMPNKINVIRERGDKPKETFTIAKAHHQYTFYYNFKPIEDVDKITLALDIIVKPTFANLYQNIMNDKDFAPIESASFGYDPSEPPIKLSDIYKQTPPKKESTHTEQPLRHPSKDELPKEEYRTEDPKTLTKK